MSKKIVILWKSCFSKDRIFALEIIITYNFSALSKIPDWARVILAHAMYLDYRIYDNQFEI